MFYQHLFSLNHPFTQPHCTQPPVTQPVLCAVHPTPRPHPCYSPTMPHSKPFSTLTPIITPTLHDHPRTNLVPWKIAINRSTRAVFAEWDQFGFLFGVCDDTVWAVDTPAPADLVAGDGPAVRDAFKRATDARASWLAYSVAFCAAILDSIGESNRLVISDPDTDTFHLSPRDIINAMTALHGTMTGAEVDTLRLPLKKKLAALVDLPAHIVTFRGHLPSSTQPDKLLLRSMRTDCFWPLCPLSPVSTSTLYCLRCKMGQLDSRRSRPTQPTCWPNTPTSSPTPTFDPSRAMSKGTRTGPARMMAWEGT